MALLLTALLCPLLARGGETAPLRVLILTGQNNHDWTTTTPKLRQILAGSGRFAVDVTERPEQLEPAMLAGYQVLLSNWNAWGKKSDAWPETARSAYLEFIRSGKGLVVVHAGSSSFSDWADYQLAAGASWKLGGTHHGAPHEFTVEPADPGHPVMRGVATFRTKDELWLKPGVQPGAKVLAIAEGQPVALATGFGKGRGFTLLLGHSAEFMGNPGFETLLLRGTEWAATGVVTLPAQPVIDADAVLRAVAAYRFGDDRDPVLKLERLAQAAAADPAKRREFAGKLLALAQSGATVDGKRQALWLLSLVAGSEEAGALGKLAADKDLAYYAKNALSRLAALPPAKTEAGLRAEAESSARALAGSPDKLAAMLAGNDRRQQRLALAALRAPSGAAALPAILGRFDALPAAVQPQIVAVLGDLGFAAGVPLLEKAASSPDPLLRQTALLALGEAGNAASVPVLVAALGAASEDERKFAVEALSRLKGDGVDQGLAAALPHSAPAVQRELVRTLAAREAKAALPALLAAAGGADSAVRQEAGSAIGRLGDLRACSALLAMLETHPDAAGRALAGICRRENTVQPLLDAMASAPAPKKVQLVAVLGAAGGGSLAALRGVAHGDDPALRTAAVRALAAWPDAAAFDDLVALAAGAGDPACRVLSIRGLARLAPQVSDRAPGQVADALARVMRGAALNEKKALLGALAKIPGPEALKIVEGYAADPGLGAEAKAAAEQIRAASMAKPVRTRRMGTASSEQMKLFDLPGNLCRGAAATSPTGLQPDGHGDVPAAAIDGDGGTYWDETDRQPLYRIRVAFPGPAPVALLRILGFHHQNYAPKTFEVLCDGRPVKQVENAQYRDNVLEVELPRTTCSAVELSITDFYGASPAIRELGIFSAKP